VVLVTAALGAGHDLAANTAALGIFSVSHSPILLHPLQRSAAPLTLDPSSVYSVSELELVL